MEQRRIVPFYQTYNMPPYQVPYMQPYAMNGYLPLYMAQETDIKEDLQYLQEMFPELAKRYAARISSVVDRMDYKGSMIYDEYPDRLRMQRLAHDIVQMIEKEEAAAEEEGRNLESPASSGNTDTGSEGDLNRMSPTDSKYREELVYVLLVYEIAKRRHGAGMDLSKFYNTGNL